MEEQEKEHSATTQQQSTNQCSTAEVQKRISEAIHSCIKENLQDPIKLEELGNSISKELDKINEPEKSCADEDGLRDITSSCVFNKATRKNLCAQRPAIPIIENSTSRRLKIIQSWLLNNSSGLPQNSQSVCSICANIAESQHSQKSVSKGAHQCCVCGKYLCDAHRKLIYFNVIDETNLDYVLLELLTNGGCKQESKISYYFCSDDSANSCFSKINKIITNDKAVTFGMITLSRFLKLDILWRALDIEAFQAGIAVTYEIINKIQYTPCYIDLDEYQKQVLWINRELFKSHSMYFFQLIRSVDYTNETMRKEMERLLDDSIRANLVKHERNYIICSSRCKSKLSVYQLITLLSTKCAFASKTIPLSIRAKLVELLRLSDNVVDINLDSNNELEKIAKKSGCSGMLAAQKPTKFDVLSANVLSLVSSFILENFDVDMDTVLPKKPEDSFQQLFADNSVLKEKCPLFHYLIELFHDEQQENKVTRRNLAKEVYHFLGYFRSSDDWLVRDEYARISLIFNYVMSAFCPDQMEELNQAQYLINMMISLNESVKKIGTEGFENNTDDIQKELKQYIEQNNIAHPFKSGVIIKSISSIEIMESNAKPFMVEFYCATKDESWSGYEKILFKFEDLIGDMAAESYIRNVSYAFPSFGIASYKVIPLSPFVGMIEVMDEFKSIRKLEPNQDDNTVLVYNEAIWMIISYLLGIGDRHNDNIGTVKRNGTLFLCHIDFGFMLGSDPNLHGVILTNMLSCFNKKLHDNQLRINDKIVSESILMKSCEIIIDELKRTYDEFFINLCFYKIPNSQFTDNEKAVKAWTNKFFLPFENQETASELFKGYFDQSKGILQKAYFFHDSRKRFETLLSDIAKAFTNFFS